MEFPPMMPPMNSPLGKIIKGRLAELERTQEWLAEETSVSTAAVSKWIRAGKMSRESAIKVAAALRVTVDQLLGGQPMAAAVPAGETTLERLDADEKRILELYRRATKDGKLMIFGAATVAPKQDQAGSSAGRPN
jgi:transcriptional regulator with XRE-family HTH domain